MKHVSFYYRDTLNLKLLFPDAKQFSLKDKTSNIILRDGCLSLSAPEKIEANILHQIVIVYYGDDVYEEITVSIRCWKEDGPYLKEVTTGLFLKKNKIIRKICRGVKRLFKTGYNSILLTHDGVTYYTYGGKLRWRTRDRKGVLSSQIKLESPEFNQMIVSGNYGFVRSGRTIYCSTDKLKTWEVVHSESYALRKSMIWDKDAESLIFSNYTGGSERVRHYLRRYNVNTGKTDTLLTFYTKKENEEQGLTPFARHIHIISEDPFTGDWYIAVGDYEDEPAIYRTTNKGQTFEKIGGGDQMWRTLSFIFKKDYILWGADSESSQYLSCISRKQLSDLPIKNREVKRYPLFNSALWFTYDDGEMTIMSSNSEGSFYDDKHRLYGINVDENGIPTVYSLFEEKSDPRKNRYIFNQLIFLDKDINDLYWFYDNQNQICRKFKLIKK